MGHCRYWLCIKCKLAGIQSLCIAHHLLLFPLDGVGTANQHVFSAAKPHFCYSAVSDDVGYIMFVWKQREAMLPTCAAFCLLLNVCSTAEARKVACYVAKSHLCNACGSTWN